MALLASCYCCSLSVCCGVLGVYLMVAYVICFAIELWWILEAPEVLPVPAYLLTLGYFALFLFSSLLLHGLSVKKNTFLLVWMFLMGIFLGPEAGLVLYMSIHHWRITSLYGLIEVTCWACRLLVNATAMICVQSLYSTWREEKSLMLRLQALKMSPVPTFHRDRLSSVKIPPPLRHNYLNHAYIPDEEKEDMIIPVTNPNTVIPTLEDNIFYDPFFVAPMENFSEFNASSFDANVIDMRAKLTTPQPETADEKVEEEPIVPKTQSLLDFRDDEYNNIEVGKANQKNTSISLNYINYLGKKETKPENVENYTQSLDRRIKKNQKNFRILRKFSPFLTRKNTDEINVYQVHPPKIIEGALSSVDEVDAPPSTKQLDNQLKKIYSNRGMYAFDEKTKKVIFYPPEFFNPEQMKKYRHRMNSSDSRSSIDDDSEDIRQICDVAL